MANFIGDIALVLSIALFCAGLIVWDVGRRQAAQLIQVSAAIMVVGGLGMSVCVAYYWLSYRFAGQFEAAYPMGMRMGPVGMGQGGMGQGGMGQGGMMRQMMQEGMMQEGMGAAAPASAAAADADHAQHHPESAEGSQPPAQVESQAGQAPPVGAAEQERMEKDPSQHPM